MTINFLLPAWQAGNKKLHNQAVLRGLLAKTDNFRAGLFAKPKISRIFAPPFNRKKSWQ
jgi:hypothetical protein